MVRGFGEGGVRVAPSIGASGWQVIRLGLQRRMASWSKVQAAAMFCKGKRLIPPRRGGGPSGRLGVRVALHTAQAAVVVGGVEPVPGTGTLQPSEIGGRLMKHDGNQHLAWFSLFTSKFLPVRVPVLIPYQYRANSYSTWYLVPVLPGTG